MPSITNGTKAHEFYNCVIRRRIIELVDRHWDRIFRALQCHKCGYVALTTTHKGFGGHQVKFIPPPDLEGYYTSAADPGEVTRIYFTLDQTRNQLIEELVILLTIP